MCVSEIWMLTKCMVLINKQRGMQVNNKGIVWHYINYIYHMYSSLETQMKKIYNFDTHRSPRANLVKPEDLKQVYRVTSEFNV